MNEIVLKVEKREGTGKEAAHKLRAAGNIPGVLYGPEVEATPIAVNLKELSSLIRKEGRSNMLIDLNLGDNGGDRKVVIRELQRDPVSGIFQHVDLYQVSMNRKLVMTVRVNMVGMPEGVKNSGGILQQTRREVEISCLPADIPNSITVDVSELGIGDSIHVSDLEIANAEIITEPRLTLCTVVPPTVIKTTAEAEAEAAAEGAEEGEGEAAEGEGAEGEEEKKEE